jgi:hypothetical protein
LKIVPVGVIADPMLSSTCEVVHLGASSVLYLPPCDAPRTLILSASFLGSYVGSPNLLAVAKFHKRRSVRVVLAKGTDEINSPVLIFEPLLPGKFALAPDRLFVIASKIHDL